MAPGMANRNGHRNTKEGSLQWGGKRVKPYATSVDTWLETEARAAIKERKLLTKAKYYELVTDQ